jgi:hypothetical protein
MDGLQREEMKEHYYRFMNGDTDCGGWGWHQLYEDWKNDLPTLRLLMNWHRNWPDWLKEPDNTV